MFTVLFCLQGGSASALIKEIEQARQQIKNSLNDVSSLHFPIRL